MDMQKATKQPRAGQSLQKQKGGSSESPGMSRRRFPARSQDAEHAPGMRG